MMRQACRNAATIIFSVAFCVCAHARNPEHRPNIIYMLADDLGYSELGCYGQKIIETPNIDRIATEGIRFTNHYSGQAVCAPARCALMTGKHMGHADVRNNGYPKHRVHDESKNEWRGQHPIADEEVTIAELLKKQGYATAAYGKWGLGYEGSSGDPLTQGFDDFGGFMCQGHAHNHYPRFLWKGGEKVDMPGNDRTLKGEEYSQDYFIKWGKEFIEANQDEPFFLYLPFAIPHLSIQVPDSAVDYYRNKIDEAEYKHKGYLEHPYPRAGYAAMVTYMDKGVGEIMQTVADLGLDENTIMIFASDNGPTFNRLGGSDSEYFESAGEFRGLKGSLYEGGIRVPLVARWPQKIQPGLVSDHISAFWDMLPTFCEIAGVAPPEEIDGLSLVPELMGNNAQAHEYLYWEFAAYGGQQALRRGNWKAIKQGLLKRKDVRTELYNLENDPGESKDLASEHPGLVAELEDLMRQARTPSERFPFPALDEE